MLKPTLKRLFSLFFGFHLDQWYARLKGNGKDIDFRIREAKKLMGLKVHLGGFKPANSLEWQSAVASMI